MKNVLALATLGIAFLLQSCSKDVLVGDGPNRTETRELASFRHIDVSGNRHVEIVKSDVYKVEVTGYENLTVAFQSKVENGYLSFGYLNHWRVKNDNISLKIYSPDLSGMHISGNNEVSIGTGFNFNDLEVSMTGNGKLFFGACTANNFKIKSNGNGETFAEKLHAQNIRVEINGNGLAEVHATKTLSVKIIGNGEVHYWGDPQVAANISGNGKTIRH